jgi:L-asparagine transporter-like permease
MWGFPVTSLAGAGLMAAALVTTYFTPEFRMTLLCGVPFMVALLVVYGMWYRRQAHAAQAVTSS